MNFRLGASSSLIRLLIVAILLISAAFAQSQPVQTQPAKTDANTQEMTTQESAPVFRVRVNQVLLKVVVRDSNGNSVRDLRKEDFEIRDNGKPQKIASFSTQEHAAAPTVLATEPHANSPQNDTAAAPLKMPERYVAYLIDDLHIETANLIDLKLAAEHHLSTLPPDDRVAVFTTSGRGQVDFTQDREVLLNAIRKVQISSNEKVVNDCPWMTYYFADLISNKEDPGAIAVGLDQTMKCAKIDRPEPALALLKATARQVLTTSDHTTKLSLMAIQSLAKRMSALPGQRIVVMISPGYLVLTDQFSDMLDNVDRALRADVVVNTLDVRGLYTDPTFDASFRLPSAADHRFQDYVRDSYNLQGDVLSTIAHGTGGTWFHNNNDLELGLRRTAGVPDVSYSIAFSPSDLKFDGSFHKLKVTINRPGSYTILTKPGYRAPSKSLQAKEAAEQEIEETFFSREEQQAVPLNVTTQYFKSAPDAAVLDVVAHLSIQQLPFRKANDRNLDTLVVVAGIFDPNGRYIEGIQKTIDFRLKDETLHNRLRSGISLKSRFKVKPGGYFIRVVIRDSEGQLVSARNSSVEIPWE